MAKAGLLFVGTADGLVLFSNPNHIGRWLRIGQPFRGHAVWSVWPLPDNPLIVFAAVDGMGAQRSDDGGQTWRTVLDVDARSIVGHQRESRAIYLGDARGDLYGSDDAGEQWQQCPAGERPTGGMLGGLVVAHEDARRLYLGLADGVWSSSDAGETWARYGVGTVLEVAGLAGAPAQPGRLYAATGDGLYSCAGVEMEWAPLRAAPTPAGGALAVLGGKTPTLVIGCADGGIARSDDGGATWAAAALDAGADGPISVIAAASYHIDTAFAGGAAGRLIASANRGRMWETLKRDVPPILSIAAARLI